MSSYRSKGDDLQSSLMLCQLSSLTITIRPLHIPFARESIPERSGEEAFLRSCICRNTRLSSGSCVSVIDTHPARTEMINCTYTRSGRERWPGRGEGGGEGEGTGEGEVEVETEGIN